MAKPTKSGHATTPVAAQRPRQCGGIGCGRFPRLVLRLLTLKRYLRYHSTLRCGRICWQRLNPGRHSSLLNRLPCLLLRFLRYLDRIFLSRAGSRPDATLLRMNGCHPWTMILQYLGSLSRRLPGSKQQRSFVEHSSQSTGPAIYTGSRGICGADGCQK